MRVRTAVKEKQGLGISIFKEDNLNYFLCSLAHCDKFISLEEERSALYNHHHSIFRGPEFLSGQSTLICIHMEINIYMQM